ncbi:MAG: RNA polymerase sigma factor [Thermoanaerobaculia bacterium]
MRVGTAGLRIVDAEPVMTDADMIEGTLAGDELSFAAIVERYQRKVHRVAAAIVRDPVDADAVTQDTFVQAYLNLGKFEGRSGLETWLTRIAINRARDALRSRRWTSLSLNDDDEDGPRLEIVDGRPDAEREMFSRQIDRAVENAVEGLSAQQKTIFRLRHYEDMPLERIAEMLGLKAGTVRAHLFRAIQKLRTELSSFTSTKREEVAP